jgi:hypothetical protein
MSEKMNELFNLTQKAQKMERINEELALELYLEIFRDYTPKISKTYESAIRLLEKRHRLQEALNICNTAIHLIKEDQISGTLEKFEIIRSRLEKKIESEKPPEPEKKPLPLKSILIVLGLVVIMLLVFQFTKPYEDLNVNLEGKEALEGGESFVGTSKDDENTPEALYPITDGMIQVTSNEAFKLYDVSDISITPQNGTIGLGIIVEPGTDANRSKEIAAYVLKALSGAASANYKELNGPTKDSLGDLYNYYELVISIGTSTEADDIIARGSKNVDASNIYWRKETE